MFHLHTLTAKTRIPEGALPQSAMPGFAAFVENALWAEGEVLFATLHLVGTTNNFSQPAAVVTSPELEHESLTHQLLH